jgi:Right handed beta helix region
MIQVEMRVGTALQPIQGKIMSIANIKTRLIASALLLLIGSAAQAGILWVNCGGKGGLNSIGAALKVLQISESHEPATIKVSGACHENVVIQSIDRLTLTAIDGASVSDASAGTLDVISINDSRDVAINGFTINAGSDGVSGANGISCADFSTCRLSTNVIQGAGSGAGFAVYQQAQATLDGDSFQNNGNGLIVNSGTKVRTGGQNRPFTSRANGIGISTGRQGLVYVAAIVENNKGRGVLVQFNSTLELFGGSISHNGGVGAEVREGSVARFTGATAITNNGGPGVLIHDLSMVTFDATVTGNGGGTDVVCNPQYSATRNVAGTGGTTNCVEP